MQNGILVVMSGFSGAGKGTIIKRLLEKYGDEFALSISATTRSPRVGETEGESYFFVSKERFEDMIDRGELLEYACYVGNYYGTPKSYVEEQMSAGRSVILEIELQGALQIKKLYPQTRLMFVTPPKAQELKERLVGRGTEPPDVIRDRLSRAYEEAEYIPQYDYLIVNDELEHAVEEVHQIIMAECAGQTEGLDTARVSGNLDFVKTIREDLRMFAKGE